MIFKLLLIAPAILALFWGASDGYALRGQSISWLRRALILVALTIAVYIVAGLAIDDEDMILVRSILNRIVLVCVTPFVFGLWVGSLLYRIIN